MADLWLCCIESIIVLLGKIGRIETRPGHIVDVLLSTPATQTVS
jgi:hypothetical protein